MDMPSEIFHEKNFAAKANQRGKIPLSVSCVLRDKAILGPNRRKIQWTTFV